MPDVSVVVIVYNDADRLPTAVQSVLDQTLRDVEVVIVDDCSTDRSFEVAQRLAADHPGRARAFQLPENSGGCGEPRNAGIQHTRGRYVMFLDSDDVLEPNACRNMLEAAEKTGADIVSGQCVRLHVDTRNKKRDEWYSWLYSTTRTIDSVTEFPDLFVWDTLSTNKCYRREFLMAHNLRFAKGLFYEDLLFIADAYLAAERITLIPNQVYFWNVYTQGAVKSVTNRRHEMRNYVHRLEVHKRIDAMLAERGLTEMKLAKDIKFLKHDLVLHLRDLPFRDEAYRREFAELSREYLAGVAPEAYEHVQPIQAICAYLLQQGDWANLIPAVDTLINRTKLSSPLAEHDGRIYWCGGHFDDAFGRGVLDVTDLGYHEKPVNQLFLRNQLTGFGEVGRAVSLTGEITNPLGLIPPGARLKGELEFSARRRSLQSFHFPVQELRHEGDAIHWAAVADLTAKLRPLGIVDTIWDVRLRLEVDGVRTTSRLTVADTALSGALPVRPRLTRMVADHLEPHVSAKGHLAFRLVSESRQAERVQELITRGVHGKPGTLAKTGYRKAKALRGKVLSGDNKIRAYHEVFSRLPVKKRTVVFESHLGKQYSDSPRALYEEMRRQGLEFEAIWSYAGSPKGFPKDATLVKRWSLPYLKALAQAEFWVDNQSYPLKLTKRPETTYLQTWHGSALKNMGFDQPALKAQTRQQQAEQQRSLDRFDRFLIRSEHDVHTLARAFRLKEKTLLRVGYPRNDALVRARQREADRGVRERGPLAAKLGIPDDKTVLLYAPTFRKAGGRHGRFELPFDVERFADRFGDRYVLLVRSHYLNHVVLPPTVQGRIIDVSGHHDVTPVLELADGLITDYSSVMFDYALLDRPLVFFTYDYDEYVHEGRGTYFDLLEHAPGPVVRTEDDFHQAIKAFDSQSAEYAESRREFVAKFGEYDQGNAAQSIVDQFFAQWSR
ncbi:MULTISPECIES: bifunctional glycosyltransferase family 2 protein/CDP-glycerol:glycerophosphate glycerophosphotransferase [unclassified Streptomyces]|uniref:bifunctional glycosyltransferase/CDP-glycerol:glycerophosphate glycerophosphotransferase n=1 Tax=unclassified Streptomyces TaxID=2593676 RepID=UPI00088FE641|nr:MULTISPECIES: bifunctional glycosyltransferase family 2 protein/CDP-glycerol:glycerophosphate glycerophosphotransferase [unclassified Streptomyces]PBC82830.1 CDP-glycerol glycerophosphotransferase [Streptomyces sp. 2321.6]SDR46842.1 CDP-glycerol glycerophosphotransferase [Streptomyces sp. KS_16]SEC73393.1 CDP-glycerol glycerophosphotransferase [Streptomyces sp. 2133.1]SEE91526.1 CDP-glycerol glycerophosphotransferase [Streptomyces sp. 2112.3]SNC68906.1 CDP-glycerol glycerophosphotransferase